MPDIHLYAAPICLLRALFPTQMMGNNHSALVASFVGKTESEVDWHAA